MLLSDIKYHLYVIFRTALYPVYDIKASSDTLVAMTLSFLINVIFWVIFISIIRSVVSNLDLKPLYARAIDTLILLVFLLYLLRLLNVV